MLTKPASQLERSPDPREVGERVLAGLDAGRARGIAMRQEHAAAVRAAVKRLADDDIARGKPERGRAGRISRELKGLQGTSERNVSRILATLSYVSD